MDWHHIQGVFLPYGQCSWIQCDSDQDKVVTDAECMNIQRLQSSRDDI